MSCKCRKKVIEHAPRCQAEQGPVTLTRAEADALRDLLEYVRQGWGGAHVETVKMLQEKVGK